MQQSPSGRSQDFSTKTEDKQPLCTTIRGKITPSDTVVISDLVQCMTDRIVLLKAINSNYLNRCYCFSRALLCDSFSGGHTMNNGAGFKGGLSRILWSAWCKFMKHFFKGRKYKIHYNKQFLKRDKSTYYLILSTFLLSRLVEHYFPKAFLQIMYISFFSSQASILILRNPTTPHSSALHYRAIISVLIYKNLCGSIHTAYTLGFTKET